MKTHTSAAGGVAPILVTGATGFVGAALVERLARDGVDTRACVRGANINLLKGIQAVQVGDLTSYNDWGHALKGISVVVHAAARVQPERNAGGNGFTDRPRQPPELRGPRRSDATSW